MADNCGYQVIDVTATDHAFDGIPADAEAGKTLIRITNDGTEYHEVVLQRVQQGETRSVEEILALPEEEGGDLLDYLGNAFAPPGAGQLDRRGPLSGPPRGDVLRPDRCHHARGVAERSGSTTRRSRTRRRAWSRRCRSRSTTTPLGPRPPDTPVSGACGWPTASGWLIGAATRRRGSGQPISMSSPSATSVRMGSLAMSSGRNSRASPHGSRYALVDPGDHAVGFVPDDHRHQLAHGGSAVARRCGHLADEGDPAIGLGVRAPEAHSDLVQLRLAGHLPVLNVVSWAIVDADP